MSLPEQLALFRLPPVAVAGRVRYIQLATRIVAYELRQAVGRKLALRIDERGLRVSAPTSLSLRAIEDFIREHAQWTVDKLDEFAQRNAPRHLAIRDGAVLPLLGEPVTVRVLTGANRIAWANGVLQLAAKPDADLDALARRALRQRALLHFQDRAAVFAARLGRPLPPVRLSSARSRWGSCSSKSGIRIHWRLIHLPPEFADYVIAHELAHLVEMNHSPRFWHVVAGLFADWQRVRHELRRRAGELPII